MLAALLLVFREVLEAALIVGIAAAATRGVAGRGRWIAAGLGMGLAGSLVVALGAGTIAGSLGGTGQEWFNAGVLLAAVVMISWHVIWMSRHGRQLVAEMKSVGAAVAQGSRPLTALLVVVAVAVLREGSEIVLFGYGLIAGGASTGALALGGVLGLLSGAAVGLALYFGLLTIPTRYFFNATNGLLVLLAAGLAASAAGYLVQADALPTLIDPLWDTSWLLSDDSVLGGVLKVLIGYSAQPSGIQMLFYASTVILLLAGMRFFRVSPSSPMARAPRSALEPES